MTAREHAARAGHSHEPALTLRAAISVWAALMALLLLTVGAAYVPLGPFNIVAALLIAVVKAGLVAVFFMHLRWSTPIARVVAAAGVAWLSVLILLTMADVLTRGPGTTPGRGNAAIAARQRQPGVEPREVK